MPIPEKPDDTENQTLVFATRSGNVRRNRLTDFYNINRAGKIAMKLDEGDTLIGVAICTDGQDVLLSAKNGKCVRFPVETLRIFESRSSTGVRGMKLADGDCLISMSILNHVKADMDKRDAYLKEASARRRASGQSDSNDVPETESTTDTVLTPEEFEKMAAEEQFILTLTEKGYGKRSSAYEYRITSRGTQGFTNIKTDEGKRKAGVVASMPVDNNAHLMLVTDAGKLIRLRVADIRIAGRSTMGVIVFRLDKNEKVVSAECITDIGDTETDSEPTSESSDQTDTSCETGDCV